MSTARKITFSFIAMLFLCAVYSMVIFRTVYDELDYFAYYGQVFMFDIFRYILFLFVLGTIIYLTGLKRDWKIIFSLLTAQTIVYFVSCYLLYLYAGKAHYIRDSYSLSKISHSSFFEWLDYLVGVRRWLYTRAVELILLISSVYFAMRIPKPEWSLINRYINNDNNSPLDKFQ